MNPLLVLLFLASSPSYVWSAPASSPDLAILLQNGLDAQTLNSEFQSLNATDACDSGIIACVGGAKAACAFGAWQIQPCQASQQCFAVPSMVGNGTILTCTSQASALSLMQIAGVDGGMMANNTNKTVAFPTQAVQSNTIVSVDIGTATSLSSTSTPADATDSVEIVTVTVTLPPLPFTTTFPSETRTLDPADAASLLSSLSAQGFSIVSTILPPSAFSTPPVAASSSASSSGNTGPIPTTHCDMSITPSKTSSTVEDTQLPSPYRRSLHKRGVSRRA